MSDNKYDTIKISASEILKLQQETVAAGPELSVLVEPETLKRIDALIVKVSKLSPTNFTSIKTEIFMEGLRTMEKKFP